MADLQTSYLNLKLKNPIIVASSGLTKSADKMKACEDAGAGAVVIKSLFEESLAKEDWGIGESTGFHTEAYDYLRAQLELQYGPKDYCEMIEKAKRFVNIPIIASVNCITSKWWPSYAKQIESAGADALELNVFTTASDPGVAGAEIEQLYLEILEAVKANVKISVAMKVGRFFSSLPNVAARLCQRGLNGMVLFNRFTELDIDINKLQLFTTFHFSRKEDFHESLRWIAILAGKVKCDLAATTGLHTSQDIIKMLLAGARVVQLASVLYKNGLEVIRTLIEEIEAWMEMRGYESIDQFNGQLSFIKSKMPDLYLRSQFIEAIRGWE